MSANELVTLTVNSRELAEWLGISKTTFRKYQRAGLFRGLEAPIPGRWSRAAIIERFGVRPPVHGQQAVA